MAARGARAAADEASDHWLSGDRSGIRLGPGTAAFVQRLHKLGWIDGRTVVIQYRWAEGGTERSAELAAELVRLKVDVIVTGENAALAAKQASSVVPIVFALVDDPVGMGVVASLADQAESFTGLSKQGTEVAGKRLALLRGSASTRATFSRVRNLPTCRSRERASLNSSSTCKQQERSALRFQPHCSPKPTRSSNEAPRVHYAARRLGVATWGTRTAA
jgi:hypothetical protein